MKVGDLIKLRDGTACLIIKLSWSASQKLPYFTIHTGEHFFPDCQHIEGWEVISESR